MIDFFFKARNFLINKYERIFFLIFLIIGAVLRLPYITKPFWYDEVWRIGSISEKYFLFFILRQKEAPISLGLALVTKLMITLFGNTEISARLFIMILGILIPSFAFLIVKKFSRNSALALFSMLIFTFFPACIIHSTELKPFVIEVFAIFLLFFFFDKFWRENTPVNLFRLALVILLGLFFATPIIFFFPVVFAMLFWKFLRSRDFNNLIKVAALSGTTLFLSFLYYKFYLSPQTGSGLFEYWSSEFSNNSGVLNYLGFLANSLFEIFRQNVFPASDFARNSVFINLFFPAVLFVFFIFGLYHLVRIKKAYFSAFVLGGTLTMIVFNFFKIWPFGAARVNLFLFSLFTIFTIFGIYEFIIFFKNRNLKITIIIILISMFGLIFPYSEISAVVDNQNNEYQMIGSGMRDAVECAKSNLQQNDKIAVYYFLAPAEFNYYYYHYDFQNPRIRGPISDVRHFNDNKDSAPHRNEEFFKDNLEKGERLWIFAMDGLEDKDIQDILNNAEKYGDFIESECEKFGDVRVYLYNGD